MSSTTAARSGDSVPTLTGWHVLIASVVLAILSAFSAWVVSHYEQDATNAASILGIVVPAFATVGAAAFGITVAYKAGQTQGEALGQEQAKSEMGDALASAKRETIDVLAGPLEQAHTKLEELAAQIQMHSLSPPGQRTVIMGVRPMDDEELEGLRFEPAGTTLDIERLESARAELARANGALSALRAQIVT